MTRSRLLIQAEDCNTGEWLIGYVCCCKTCRTAPYGEPIEDERPYGLMTSEDGSWGNVRVYTDTMRFYN